MIALGKERVPLTTALNTSAPPASLEWLPHISGVSRSIFKGSGGPALGGELGLISTHVPLLKYIRNPPYIFIDEKQNKVILKDEKNTFGVCEVYVAVT